MEKTMLRFGIRHSQINTVVISEGEVLISMRGGTTYRFPERGSVRMINRLRANIPSSKIIDPMENLFDDIIDSVCDVYNQDKLCVYTKTRKREVVQTRQICMSLSRLKTKKSLIAIGQYYGGFDHTTVLHSMKTVKNLLDTNKQFKSEVGHLFEGLKWPHFKN